MDEYYSEYGGRAKRRHGLVMGAVDLCVTFVTAVVAVTMALTLLVPYVNPARVWFFSVLGLAAPVVYVATVVLALYWIIRWRWGRAGTMLVLVFLGFFKVSLFYRPEWRRSYGEKSYDRSAFKVMTYNVRCFFGNRGQSSVDDVARLIGEIDPDVICLQEFNLRLAERSEAFTALADRYERRYFSMETNSDYPVPMAVLSKFRIIRSGVVLSPANSVWADLLIGEDTVRLFSNHLRSTAINAQDNEFITQKQFLSDTAREEKVRSIVRRFHENSVLRAAQVDSIARQVGDIRTRRIVCGDFNDTPMSYVYRTMARGLKDAFSACGTGYSHTYLGFFNTLRIDYVLSSDGLETLSYEVPDADCSDHLPVVVRLRKTTDKH